MHRLWCSGIFVGVMPHILEIHDSFPHFSPTWYWAEILHITFDYLYYSSSSSVVNLCQFVYARLQTGRIMALWCPSGSPSVRPSQFSGLLSYMLWCIELFLIMKIRSSSSFVNFRRLFFLLCPVWNLEYWKYTVFCVFPWHALTYWAEICILVLFCFTVLQIKFECRKFASILWELCPFWNLEYWNSQFFVLFSYMLWHNELKFYIDLCFTVLQIKVWVLWICVNLCGSYAPFGTQNTGNTVFRSFLLHALTYWAEILHMTFFTALHITVEWRQFASIFVGVMPLLELRILEIHRLFFAFFSCINVLWHIDLKFLHMTLFYCYCRSNSSVINFRQFL